MQGDFKCNQPEIPIPIVVSKETNRWQAKIADFMICIKIKSFKLK